MSEHDVKQLRKQLATVADVLKSIDEKLGTGVQKPVPNPQQKQRKLTHKERVNKYM